MKIKRLVYLDGLIKSESIPEQHIVRLKKLEELIGKWHDAELAEDLVEEYAPESAARRNFNAQRTKLLHSIRKEVVFLR